VEAAKISGIIQDIHRAGRLTGELLTAGKLPGVADLIVMAGLGF
jgi:hypothetical protein